MAGKLNLGIAWYTPDQWTRMRQIAADPERLEETYGEWLRIARKAFRDFEAQGLEPIRVYIDPDELVQWCKARRIAIDGPGRASFARHKTEELTSSISLTRSEPQSVASLTSAPAIDAAAVPVRKAQDRIEDYICGGYFLVNVARSYRKSDLLPDAILSGSPCIVENLPGLWALHPTMKTEARREAASHSPIAAHDVDRFLEWTDERRRRKEIGLSSVFCLKQTADELLESFQFDRKDWRLLAIGLREDQAGDFLENFDPPRQGLEMLYVEDLVRRRQAPHPGGRLLGFEVLAIADSECHSWLCNSLEEYVPVELGIRPGPYGLLPDWSDADQCAEYASRPEVGAEDLPWYAWAIISYPI